MFDTGAWFIHGCPISRVAKPEIKGAIYRIRRSDAPRVEDPRGSKLDLASSPIADVAKIIEDTRPAVRDRAIEFLVQAGAAAVPALASLRGSSKHERRAQPPSLRYIESTREKPRRSSCSPQRFQLQRPHSRCPMRRHEPRYGSSPATHRNSEGRSPGVPPASDRSARADRGRARPACISRRSRQSRRPLRRTLNDLLPHHAEPARGLQKELPARIPKSAKPRSSRWIRWTPLHCGASRSRRCSELPTRNSLRRALGRLASPRLGRVVLAYLGERLHDPRRAPEELESVRDALVAFSENKSAQEFVAKTLADSALGEKQVISCSTRSKAAG